MKVGVAFADIFTGLYASIGILSALYHRHTTGNGQYIDMALLDSQIAVLANQALNFLVGGKIPTRPRQRAPEYRALPNVSNPRWTYHHGGWHRPAI